MRNQVTDFALRVRSGTIRFNQDRTLFFIAGGQNDSQLPIATTSRILKMRFGNSTTRAEGIFWLRGCQQEFRHSVLLEFGTILRSTEFRKTCGPPCRERMS